MKEPRTIKSLAELSDDERGITLAASAQLRNVQNWSKENPELAKTHRPHIHSDGRVTIEPIKKIEGFA